jgi:hypothetical protein
MTCRIKCTTLFDITATGIRNNYKESRLPVRDDTGQMLMDQQSWIRSRNQQRNWETINQIIALRCLPENISTPVKEENKWIFDFELSDLSTVSMNDNDLHYLQHDANGVPMIVGLDESHTLEPVISTTDENPNVFFELVNHKY